MSPVDWIILIAKTVAVGWAIGFVLGAILFAWELVMGCHQREDGRIYDRHGKRVS